MTEGFFDLKAQNYSSGCPVHLFFKFQNHHLVFVIKRTVARLIVLKVKLFIQVWCWNYMVNQHLLFTQDQENKRQWAWKVKFPIFVYKFYIFSRRSFFEFLFVKLFKYNKKPKVFSLVYSEEQIYTFSTCPIMLHSILLASSKKILLLPVVKIVFKILKRLTFERQTVLHANNCSSLPLSEIDWLSDFCFSQYLP